MTVARIDDLGDRIVVVNMNAARRGALSPDYYATVEDAVRLAQAPRVRAVILASEGGFFCSGGDLKGMIERRNLSEPERKVRVDGLHAMMSAIRTCPVPVIAAVEGGAAGAGLSLALACDLLVAASDALFTASYVRAGLVPDGGLTASLSRMLPRQLAMEMCLFAQPVTAARFADLGVVNMIATPGDAAAQAHRLADALAKGPRTALSVVKRLVGQAYNMSEADQLLAERDAMVAAQVGAESAEGIAAFLEKRPPRFGTEPAISD